jgi:regulator of protease activity HflC (stomatin/prohibitin superfamily)
MKNDKAGGEILVLIGVFILIMILVTIFTGLFTVVPAGNVGVADTFGVVDENAWNPGLHIKAPWTGITMFSGQTQKYMDYTNGDVATITALSNEELLLIIILTQQKLLRYIEKSDQAIRIL